MTDVLKMPHLFSFSLADAYKEVAACNTEHGWRPKRHPWWQFWKGKQPHHATFPELLALIHSELSEALEDYRNDNFDHISEEIADVFIRLIDLCDQYDIDLAKAYREKMDINWKRPYRHGGNRRKDDMTAADMFTMWLCQIKAEANRKAP